METSVVNLCPVCSAHNIANSGTSYICYTCSFSARYADWQKLSDAAALARAVEKIGTRVESVLIPQQSIEIELEDGVGWFASIIDSDDRNVSEFAAGATAAAALIALAEQVNE